MMEQFMSLFQVKSVMINIENKSSIEKTFVKVNLIMHVIIMIYEYKHIKSKKTDDIFYMFKEINFGIN